MRQRRAGGSSLAILTIALPLPPDVLRPNKIAGADRRAVTKARRRVRKEAGEVAASAWRGQCRCDLPLWCAVRAQVTFTGVSRQMDGDNAHGWLKSVRDGIADALCGGQDHEWVWDGEPRYAKGAAGMTICVWPVAPTGSQEEE